MAKSATGIKNQMLSTLGQAAKGQRDMMLLLFAMIVILVTFVMVLPPGVVDLLLALNITLSLVILMTVSYLHSPLELSSFPTILLGVTLYRLALNVATTKLILGPDSSINRAGKIIPTFSEFLTNSSGGGPAGAYVLLGFIIFLIITLINFIVITKGAGRIAEVSARFTLDAMPGKQMAIDADLNAGLIDEAEARQRREEMSSQADFYGAMDGASKFVRGDAIAGLVITGVNLVGGLIIGMAIYGKDFPTALEEYTLLSIGDGLVSQIPALLVSVGAGVIITRSDSDNNLGAQVVEQLFTRKSAMISGGVFLLIFWMLIPSLFFLLILALALLYFGYKLPTDAERSEGIKKKAREKAAKNLPGGSGGGATGAGGGRSGAEPGQGGPEDVSNLLKLDQIQLEVGYSLIPLVDASQGGDLLERITMMRRQLALELGLLISPVRVRDNMQLQPNDYSVKLRDSEIAHGSAMPDQFLAMDTGVVTEKVEGMETIEPAFGLPAVWIPESLRETASLYGYTVADATSVISTHLTEVIRSNAAEILSRQTVSQMLEKQKEATPAIVEEVQQNLRLSEIQAVLKNLLTEKVSIRNLEVILEALGDYGETIKDPEVLTEYVRARLGRNICMELVDEENRLYCVTLSPELEDVIRKSIHSTDRGSYLSLDPDMVQKVTEASASQLEKLVNSGHHPVVLCSGPIRPQLSNLLRNAIANVKILSYNEIVVSVNVESVGVISMPGKVKK